ncbi:MAG: MarR family transcriptional regulator [Hydrogenophilales bacterium 16-64-46]|nr:MAG: MarR family transcriptional regulator [Hydrogenophilales bacterium 12-64-13]OYZ05914.1 MAG: MarR family transcriptional regulator [Hydrogenophilales bacterium 16-64-46]OZA39850.1 MAG: MarR family transcriptional regulator [Hydrogenophilales bacterium 17-64-34]HQT00271.1 MarR family transcriptional regulator [Thiobacillus sp.]
MSPPTPPPPAASEALRQFRVIFGAVRQHFHEVEKACGVSSAQIWALSALRDTPGMKVSELAQALSIHASTASNMLDKIEKAGLIRRERNSADQRVVRLYLTEAGLQIVNDAPRPLTGILTHALSNLPESTLARLNDDLRQLIAQMDTADVRDAQKPLTDI